MSANTQHKLFNLAVTPPPGTWEGISERLDREFDAAESSTGDKLYQMEATPPAFVWDNISAAIGAIEAQPIPVPAKVVRFPFVRIAAAAVVLGIVSVLTWNFLQTEDVSSGTSQRSVVTTLPGKAAPPPAADAIDDAPLQPSTPIAEAAVPRRTTQPIDVAAHVSRAVLLAGRYNNGNNVDLVKDIHCARMKGLQAEITAMRKGINAPLIRDAGGRVIMDEKLITTSDNCYVIVTGPNGEQTRISTKFLPVLNCLHEGMSPSELIELLRHDDKCQSRFQEWRRKLLGQASFVPTVNNFLDIVELKDILQEQ